jgi:protein-S-isoprenylcysteine O-methyltransferase Ste14
MYFQPTTYGKLDGTIKQQQQQQQQQQQHRSWHWSGPRLPSKWSWMVFESPCWLWIIFALARYQYHHHYHHRRHEEGRPPTTAASSSLLLSYQKQILILWFFGHYINRSIVYPLRLSTKSTMPLGISLCALTYTFVNGYIQSYELILSNHNGSSPPTPSLQFWIGVILGLVGVWIGCTSDQTLLRLKKKTKNKDGQQQQQHQAKGGYQIPYGGMFHYVSCPHYFGEIVEWIGYAMACDFSLGSISFAVWTMANLIPRALSTHRWYHDTFCEDYPESRKAIIPLVW